jgi:hypothetical protein
MHFDAPALNVFWSLPIHPSNSCDQYVTNEATNLAIHRNSKEFMAIMRDGPAIFAQNYYVSKSFLRLSNKLMVP